MKKRTQKDTYEPRGFGSWNDEEVYAVFSQKPSPTSPPTSQNPLYRQHFRIYLATKAHDLDDLKSAIKWIIRDANVASSIIGAIDEIEKKSQTDWIIHFGEDKNKDQAQNGPYVDIYRESNVRLPALP